MTTPSASRTAAERVIASPWVPAVAARNLKSVAALAGAVRVTAPDGLARTVTGIDAVWSTNRAMMLVVPGRIPLTMPVSDTVAMVVSALEYVTVAAVRSRFNVSFRTVDVAWAEVSWPMASAGPGTTR